MIKGKDLKQPIRTITLNEKEYTLSFDMNTLEFLEEFYDDVDIALKESFTGSIKSVKVLLWASINSGKEDYIPLHEVGSMISIDIVPEIKRIVLDGFLDSLPQAKGDSGKK